MDASDSKVYQEETSISHGTFEATCMAKVGGLASNSVQTEWSSERPNLAAIIRKACGGHSSLQVATPEERRLLAKGDQRPITNS